MLFFFTTLRPTKSTLFPYTTLFRSSRVPREGHLWRPSHRRAGRRAPVRSEEHTSELQSQSNLVCRLLLEKKNKKALLPRQIERRQKLLEQRRPSIKARLAHCFPNNG